MKHFLVFALIPLFASCVPRMALETTRTPGDEKALRDHAIIRPRWPNPMNPEENRTLVNTSVSTAPDGRNRGVHDKSLADIRNLGFRLDPGPCSIGVRSGKVPYLAFGRLDFTATKGKVYRFRARIDASNGGAASTHYWELYEEDTGKVILRKEVQPDYRPVITPQFIAI
jgi:hypothetical protein